ncbi:SasC/FmtB family protein, partial [Granulicatella sp.]
MFNRKDYKEKQLRYSIRKVSFGAASVAISALYLLTGNAAVSASEVQAVNGDQTAVANPTVKDNEDKSRIEKHEATAETANSTVATLDKTDLIKLIEEIDGKFDKGAYATKTEESVQYLKTVLEEARAALNNATIQAELKLARIKLATATTKLQTKPEEKKQSPAVDTTNGKPTVGKKATNTEKASDSNSIANSGSRDERHGKALDRSNPFRTDATTTDTHANNEAGVSIINGNFEEGTVKPSGNEKIVTNDASNVVGWHVVDSKQTEIPIADVRKKMKWVSVGSVDGNHPYGVVMAGYRSLKTGSNPGTDRVDTIGKIYQDINVTPGSEVLVKYRTSSFGNGAGWSTVKMTVKNPDTGEVYYSGQPNRVAGFSDGLAFINVPKNVNKIRLEFEDADNFTHSYQGYDDSFISKDGTKLYPGGVLSNVRVNTGAYVVAKENQTKYEVTSTTNNASTTSKDITVKVENKGWESTARGVKYKVDLPQGVTATYGGRTYSGTMEIDLGAIGNKTEKNFTYRLNIPAGTPSITNLVGKVEYKTWQNSEAVPYGETKTGVVPIPDQNVELKMFKTELETAVAGAANLNQNEYTPDSWKKFQDEITKAREILNEERNNVPINQRKSQSEINNQVSLLRAKQNSLTVAATTTEKNNLSAKVAELTKASTENKTPNSIEEYNKEFKKFEQDFNSIKTEVSNIIAKGNNATRDEVETALSKVAEVRRKLDTAAGLLVDKGNKTELERVVGEESTVKGNFKYYNADKKKRDAYDLAITNGKDVINNPNATQAEVDAAKQAIEAAKGKLDGAETNKADLITATSTDAEST